MISTEEEIGSVLMQRFNIDNLGAGIMVGVIDRTSGQNVASTAPAVRRLLTSLRIRSVAPEGATELCVKIVTPRSLESWRRRHHGTVRAATIWERASWPHHFERGVRNLLIRLGPAIAFGAFLAWETIIPFPAMADPAARAPQPACATTLAQPETIPGAVSIVYKMASGRPLRMHLFTPGAEKGGRPAVLFFFGGGWRTGDIRAFLGQAEALADQGYVAALADYRVRCRDGTSPLDALEDAQSAFEWLVKASGELGADPERIILVGASAGGQLALATAMLAPPEHRPAALVLFNPAMDLGASAPQLGSDAAAAKRMSPSTLPVSALPPTLVLHGGADRTIPIKEVEAFCDRARAAGRTCRVAAYPGEDHGFFDSREPRSPLARSPYADTLAKLLEFLSSLGLTGRPEG